KSPTERHPQSKNESASWWVRSPPRLGSIRYAYERLKQRRKATSTTGNTRQRDVSAHGMPRAMSAEVGRPLDPDGVLRVVGELCAVLRRRGVPVAPPELSDAARALALLGLDRRDVVREALAATLVKRQAHRPIFDEVFQGFFAPGAATPIDLFERLR